MTPIELTQKKKIFRELNPNIFQQYSENNTINNDSRRIIGVMREETNL